MTYHIIRRHMHKNWQKVHHVTNDPCKAYELAHTLQANIWGLGEEKGLEGPYTVHIRDDNNVNQWQHCSRCRCPSGIRHEYKG